MPCIYAALKSKTKKKKRERNLGHSAKTAFRRCNIMFFAYILIIILMNKAWSWKTEIEDIKKETMRIKPKLGFKKSNKMDNLSKFDQGKKVNRILKSHILILKYWENLSNLKPINLKILMKSVYSLGWEETV